MGLATTIRKQHKQTLGVKTNFDTSVMWHGYNTEKPVIDGVVDILEPIDTDCTTNERR